AAVRAALVEEPGVFAPVAAHPATESALVASYRELRDASPAGLDAIARMSARAADVVRLHRATRQRLAGEWYDEQDLMASAAAHLPQGGLGPVVVYLPQRLTAGGAALLRAVGEESDVVVLAGSTGVIRADAQVVAAVGRLIPEGGGRAGPAAADPLADLVGPDRTRIVTASDSDDEVRAAVRAVIDASRGGTPFDRIAILHASPDPYARLVHEQLAA